MWRIEQCSNEPYPRCAHQCDTVDDYIYMFGGWTDENQMLNDLHRFNIDTWEWEEIKSNKTIENEQKQQQGEEDKIEIINEPLILSRNGHSFNRYGKKLVLFGGGSFAGFLNDVVFFDTQTLKWESASVEGTPPSGRSKHAATLVHEYSNNNNNNINNSIGGKLYIFGGGDGVRLHNDLYFLDLQTMYWTLVEAKGVAPSPRWGHTMVSINVDGNQKLLIFGGHSGSKRLNDLHLYDIATNQWSQPILTSESSESPQPRAGHSASMVGSQMLVFGGGDGHILNDFFALDINNWRWWKITADTPGGRCAHSSSIIKNKLVIFGGGNGLHCIKKMVVFENIDNIEQLYQQAKLKNEEKNHSTTTAKKIVITPKKLVKPADENLLSNTIESIAKKVQQQSNQINNNSNSNNNNSNNSFSPIETTNNINSTMTTPPINQPIKLNFNDQQQPQQLQQNGFTENINVNEITAKEDSPTSLLVQNPVADKLKDSCLTDRERRDIKFFLTNIGMAKFINKFIEEEIDTTVLHLLTEDHLKQLGVTLLGDRLTIIKGIRESTLFLFKGLPPIPIDIDPNLELRIDDDKLDL